VRELNDPPEIDKRNRHPIGAYVGIGVLAIGSCLSTLATPFLNLSNEPSPSPGTDSLIHSLGIISKDPKNKTSKKNGELHLEIIKEELVRKGKPALPYLCAVLNPDNDFGIPSIPGEAAIQHDLEVSGDGDIMKGAEKRINDLHRYMKGDSDALAPKWRGVEEVLQVIKQICNAYGSDESTKGFLLSLWKRKAHHPWAKESTEYWKSLSDALFAAGDYSHLSELVVAYEGKSKRNRFGYTTTKAEDVINERLFNLQQKGVFLTFDSFPLGGKLKKTLEQNLIQSDIEQSVHFYNSRFFVLNNTEIAKSIYRKLSSKKEFDNLMVRIEQNQTRNGFALKN